jgi:hypothetical protein
MLEIAVLVSSVAFSMCSTRWDSCSMAGDRLSMVLEMADCVTVSVWSWERRVATARMPSASFFWVFVVFQSTSWCKTVARTGPVASSSAGRYPCFRSSFLRSSIFMRSDFPLSFDEALAVALEFGAGGLGVDVDVGVGWGGSAGAVMAFFCPLSGIFGVVGCSTYFLTVFTELYRSI